MEKPSAETRKHCFRLIRECITGLGWRYKAYAAGFILMSLVFILPPLLLQNFTKGVTDPQALSAADFIRNLALFGFFIAICQWIGIFVGSYLSEWLRLTVSIGLRRKVLGSLHQTQIESLDVDHGRTFPADIAVRPLVKREALTVGGQHRRLAEADRGVGGGDRVHPAG